MSNQYAGGFISKTPPTVTTASAQGMWTLSQQAQYQKAGVWPSPPPTVIGQAYGGGFYAGKINVSSTQYYLIVAPKASGESSASAWGPDPSAGVSFSSVINGPSNTTGEAALGSSYAAATFCNNLNSGSGLNGYTDWYLPAKNELEVCYYNLKPTTTANNTSSGSNANAVSPEPTSQNYTSGSPAQTTATGTNGFRVGETEAFDTSNGNYWSSSEFSVNNAWRQNFDGGLQNSGSSKSNAFHVRAVRRVPV